jgi:hypothetical protein
MFHDLCAGPLDAARRDAALAALWQLETVDDAGDITALFTVQGGAE